MRTVGLVARSRIGERTFTIDEISITRAVGNSRKEAGKEALAILYELVASFGHNNLYFGSLGGPNAKVGAACGWLSTGRIPPREGLVHRIEISKQRSRPGDGRIRLWLPQGISNRAIAVTL